MLDFLRVVSSLCGLNSSDDVVPESLVLACIHREHPVPLLDHTLDERSHAQGVRWMKRNCLGVEVVVEGFIGGGDVILPFCVNVCWDYHLGP